MALADGWPIGWLKRAQSIPLHPHESSIAAGTIAPAPVSTFEQQLIELCTMLERWRGKVNKQPISDPNEFPDTNWRAGGYTLAFLALAETAVLVQSWLKEGQGIFTFSLYLCLVAICCGAGLIQALHFIGVFDPQFWRVMRSLFKKTDNYPFTPLLRTMERDFVAGKQFAHFSDAVITAAHERIGSEESDLRDRIAVILGQPSMALLVGLLGGAWGSWKSYHSGGGLVETLFCVLSIGLFVFAIYGMRLRVSLLDLARCRGMLSLEIARRKAAQVLKLAS